MPIQYHSKSFDNENRIKKQIVKFLDNSAPDVVLRGTTVKDEKGYEGIVAICDSIETASELVLKVISRVITDGAIGSWDKVNSLEYNKLIIFLKKGIQILKKVNLKGYPAGDIEILENYARSLSLLLEDIIAQEDQVDSIPVDPNNHFSMEFKQRAVNQIGIEVSQIEKYFHIFIGNLNTLLKIQSVGTASIRLEGGYALHKGAPHYLPQRFL